MQWHSIRTYYHSTQRPTLLHLLSWSPTHRSSNPSSYSAIQQPKLLCSATLNVSSEWQEEAPSWPTNHLYLQKTPALRTLAAAVLRYSTRIHYTPLQDPPKVSTLPARHSLPVAQVNNQIDTNTPRPLVEVGTLVATVRSSYYSTPSPARTDHAEHSPVPIHTLNASKWQNHAGKWITR